VGSRGYHRSFPRSHLLEAQLNRCPLLLQNVNYWNATTAQTVGGTQSNLPLHLTGQLSHPRVFSSDLPEILAGQFISGTSATTTTTTTNGQSTSTSTSTSSVVPTPPPSPYPPPSGKASNTGAIAGGVAGGVVAVSVVVGLLFYFLRQRTRPQAPSSAFDGGTPAPSMSYMSHLHQPQSDDGMTAYMPGSPVTTTKLYVRVFFVPRVLLHSDPCRRTRMTLLRTPGTARALRRVTTACLPSNLCPWS
jgi:hypothetical protein